MIEKIEIKNKDEIFASVLYVPVQTDIMLAEKINEMIDVINNNENRVDHSGTS